MGNQARGIVITGPITPCVNNAAAGYTCANDGTAAASSGAFANFGTISVVGTTFPNRKGGNIESGSAMVIANSIAGGFFNAGPSTSNGTTASADQRQWRYLRQLQRNHVLARFADRSVPVGDHNPSDGARSRLVRPVPSIDRFGGWRQGLCLHQSRHYLRPCPPTRISAR